MERVKQILIPKRFASSFKDEIKLIDSSVKVGQQEEYFVEIFTNSFDKDIKNQTIQAKLAEIGLSDEKKIKGILQWLHDMHDFFQNFAQMVEQKQLGDIEEMNPQKLLDWNFELFVHKKYFNHNSMVSILEKLGLEINDSQNTQTIRALFSKLSDFIDILQFDEFRNKVELILSQFTDIEDLKQEKKLKIYRAFFHRNLCFDQIKSSKVESLLDKNDLMITLDILYNNIEGVDAQTLMGNDVESKEAFHTRVLTDLSEISAKFDGWTQKKQNSFIQTLYAYSKTLVKNQIIEFLKNSGLKQFKNEKLITDEILLTLFKLDSAKQFKNSSSIERKIEPPKYQQNKQNIVEEEAFDLPNMKKDESFAKSKNKIQKQQGVKIELPSKREKKVVLSPEEQAKRNAYKLERISQLQKQLRTIYFKTQNKSCFQTLVRQLEITLLEENSVKIRQKSQEIKSLVLKYDMKTTCFADLDEIRQDVKQFKDRLPKITTLTKKLYFLNLVEIGEGRTIIMGQRADMCKDAESILIIGRTGAGKSTLMTALAGHKIVRNPESNDYRAQNDEVARQIPISNNQESETRYANVKYLAATYSKGGKTFVLIDTPGFEDNRGQQVEITNNIATVNLIKKLKNARILIVLSQEQFYGARQIQNYTKFVKLFSNYFLDVTEFEQAINIVLTKGLTGEELLKTIQSIQTTQTFKKIDWNQNQKEFQRIFKEKLEYLAEFNEIKDPSQHKFKSLADSIMKTKPRQRPGNDIIESFSPAAKISIKETYSYLEKMVKKTFELEEFILTAFYLNNIKELQEVERSGTFEMSKKQLKQSSDKMLKSFKMNLGHYLSSNDENYLNKMKQIHSFFKNPESQKIYSILYEQDENSKKNSPKEICENDLNQIIQRTKNDFKNDEKIEDDRKKVVKSTLRLMKDFGFQSVYEDIKVKIQTQVESNQKQFKRNLEAKIFDEGKWKITVDKYLNQFNESDRTNNINEKYEGIRNIVMNYINSNPQQLQDINNYIECAMSQSLGGSLFKICTQYLNKLIIIRDTHYILKQAVEPKIKDIIQKLDKLTADYELQRLNSRTISIVDFQKWEIYNQNLQQIYQIKSQYPDYAQMLEFCNTKKQQSMLVLFFDNLSKNIEQLQKLIYGMPQNPQNINPDLIKQKLQTIFGLLIAMQAKKENKKIQQSDIKSSKIGSLPKVLEDSYRKINSIISTIERTANIQTIKNYELNLKLINALTVVQQFIEHANKLGQQKMQQKLENLKKKIESKILTPLDVIKNDKFQTPFSFDKLFKMLKYMKTLDRQAGNLSFKADKFDFFVNFRQREDIDQILCNCLTKISNDFNQFRPVIQLALYGEKNSLGTTKIEIQEKKGNINELSYELMEKATKYIRSFEFIKKIAEQFYDDLRIVEDFMKSQLQKSDLKSIIKSRMNVIARQLESDRLTINDIEAIKKQFNFLNMVHSNTKLAEEMDYTLVANKIQALKKNLGQNFDQLYEYAKRLYKNVYNDNKGVQSYDTLSDLSQHQGLSVGSCRDNFISLLKNIDNQYQTILQTLFINFDPTGQISESTDVFLNIFEFINIVQQFGGYLCKLKIQLLEGNLNNFFSQIQHGFETILDGYSKGIPINEPKVKQLIRYQRKIQLSLHEKYKKFLREKELKNDLFQEYSQKKKVILNNTIDKYTTKDGVVFDQNYIIFYQNATPVNRSMMLKAAKQKNEEEVKIQQKFIDTDHEKLLQYFMRKFKELENMPKQIRQPIEKKMFELEKKRIQMEEQNIEVVTKAIEQKKPNEIINCLIKGYGVKNKKIQEEAVQGVKTYFAKEEQALDLNDLQNFEKTFKFNLDLADRQNFKEASKNESQVPKSFEKFVETVKTRVQQKNKNWEKQMKNFKKSVIDRVSTELVTINNFRLNPIQNKIIQSGSQAFSVFEKFKDKLSKEVFEFKKTIEEKIKEENYKMKDTTDRLAELKKRVFENRVVDKEDFSKFIKEAQVTKETCKALEGFNRFEAINSKVDKVEINSFNKILMEMKEDLRKKYHEASNWNLQEFINQENIISNNKENEQSFRGLELLNSLKQIFFTKTQMSDNIIASIQKSAVDQFDKFETSVLSDIDKFFKASVECQSENVAKYYKLIGKLKETRSIRFPQNMKFTNKVKEKLIKRFTANVIEIENFYEKEQNKKKYVGFLNESKKIDNDQRTKIQQIKEQTKTKKNGEQQILRQKLVKEKQNVPENEPNRDQKIKELEKQFDVKKAAKFTDLNQLEANKTKQIQVQTTKLKQSVQNNMSTFLRESLIESLIVFQRAVTYFYCEEGVKNGGYSAKSFFQQVQKKYGKKIFKQIYVILSSHDSPHAQTLTGEKCFESISQSKWRELVNGSTIDKLMDKIPHLNKNRERYQLVMDRYGNLEETYEKLTKAYQKASDINETKKRFVDETIVIAAKLSTGYQKKDNCTHHRWELIGRISALWTIQRSQVDQDNNIEFIHKPHPGQILAIFMLLQFDQKSISQTIHNTMIQVSTGEGKSVILGILSTYLALIGFTVYEACYSKYLSQRDYKDFYNLFQLFGVQHKIFYKTFPEICKMMLDQSPEKPFNLEIQKLIINPSFWDRLSFRGILPKIDSSKNILLIDEADAFLDQNYIGQSFYPSISIRKSTVRKLLDYVWKHRQSTQSLVPNDIIKSHQFITFCSEFNNSNFTTLMENQTHAMVRDLKTYKDDSYTLENGRIFYKAGDSLTDKIHYGYRTIFSYYHEYYINKSITETQFNEQVLINLIVASFSYSKLPSYFGSILGVTGTLDCMSQKQKEILTDKFNVKRTFVQPSIYPDSRRIVTFVKCSEQNLLQSIVENIDSENKKKRPVIVFFKSKSQVYHFFNSKEFEKFKSCSTIVTHEVHPDDRQFRIEMSTIQSKITLLTIDFGRGTDFKMKVKDAKDHPGLHVICTFLPSSYSDYLQIVGRTGRQGKNGTARVFILQDSSLPNKDIAQKQAQDLIKKLDNDHWNQKYDDLIGRMQKADGAHDESVKLFSSGSHANKIFEKMQIFNKEPLCVRMVSKTVIGIDATSSMGNVFQSLIEVIQTALPRIEKAITNAKVEGSFEIKLVIYRNYNSKAEELFAKSNFSGKPSELADWLKNIEVSGGWVNEALEVCLQYINSLPEVGQYVIISDAKGHCKEEIPVKRNRYHGDSYFTNNGFPPTTVEDQLQKLKLRNIKGHFYYLKPSVAKSYYENLKKETNGVAEEFPINDNNSVEHFTNFIADKIITDLGNLVGGVDTVKLLMQHFKKARAT